LPSRAHVAPYIEPFFPFLILYCGVASLVFGNFLNLYYYMLGLTKREKDGLVVYAFLVPFIGWALAWHLLKLFLKLFIANYWENFAWIAYKRKL